MSTYSWHNYYLTLEGIWAFVKEVSIHTLSFGSPVNIMYNMGTIWMSSTCLLPILLCFSRLHCLHEASPTWLSRLRAPEYKEENWGEVGEELGSGIGLRFSSCPSYHFSHPDATSRLLKFLQVLTNTSFLVLHHSSVGNNFPVWYLGVLPIPFNWPSFCKYLMYKDLKFCSSLVELPIPEQINN